MRRALLAAAGTVSLAAAAPGPAREEVMIAARDGVRLATDIYRPASPRPTGMARWPVLLHRTPYGKRREAVVAQAAFFAAHGYVAAVQDMRGRHRSEGAFTKYDAREAMDGYDTIQWLAGQPWAGGRVGMWGRSYAAHVQADAAKLAPPALGPLVLHQGGMANAWDHAVRHGGAFELGRELTWAFRQISAETKDPVLKARFAREKVEDWYAALPFRKGLNPLSAAPEYEDYFLEEMTRSDYDDFWKATGYNWVEYYEQTADVPMLHVGGWFDIFLRGTIDNFVALSRIKRQPMRLVVGPWTHGGEARTYAGDVDFGPGSAIPDFATSFHLRWFDEHLKGRGAAGNSEAPVRLFVMGGGSGRKDEDGRLVHGGHWREAAAWPVPGATPTPLYLHADGALRPAPPAAPDSATTYTFDPRLPVPTLGGSVSSRLKDGAYDQRERPDFFGSRPPYLPLSARRDVLVFQTDPLPADVTVIGPIEVRLFVSSTARDTDFTAKLLDVYPPSADFPSGFDLNLTDALQRASYRDGRTTRDLIEPGRVYEIVVRPFPTANVFRKGHRIRIDVSSSNFPRFDVNPNTGEPLGRHRREVAAANTVHHSAAHPSQVVLPVMPPRQ